MSPEQIFIHDIVNKLTIALGELDYIISSKDKLSKEEILESVAAAKLEVNNTFTIIKARKNELEQ